MWQGEGYRSYVINESFTGAGNKKDSGCKPPHCPILKEITSGSIKQWLLFQLIPVQARLLSGAIARGSIPPSF
jgi:hypothetical protein